MGDWWIVLGIDETTTDMREIKRAYSRKLKQINQEENPDAFIDLRNAYEIARHVAQNENAVLIDTENYQTELLEISADNPTMANLESFRDDNAINYTRSQFIEPQISTLLEKIVKDADQLMRSVDLRQDKDNWEKIFDEMQDLSVDEYLTAENSLLYNMLEYCLEVVNERAQNRVDSGYRPHFMRFETASYIFDQFGWNNPDNPKRFNPEISELRHWLDVHTKKAQLQTPQASEKFEASDIDWGAIQSMIFGTIFVFYLIYRVISANG